MLKVAALVSVTTRKSSKQMTTDNTSPAIVNVNELPNHCVSCRTANSKDSLHCLSYFRQRINWFNVRLPRSSIKPHFINF